MPLTHSGRLVSLDRPDAPTLEDIALGLSRQPRFTGQTRIWFSVLDHSLFMYDMAQGETPDVQLAVLLHDAHESLTGDVPTGFKPEELRELQKGFLDTLIMEAHFPGGVEAYEEAGSVLIPEYDARALVAEAIEIGPPNFRKYDPANFIRLMGRAPGPGDVLRLREMVQYERLSRPNLLAQGVEAANVRDFVARVRNLQGAIRGTP
jgi:hypothetical protein